MLKGEIGFEGAQLTGHFLLVTSFLTIVLCIAQDNDSPILLLDVIQSLLCWPSIIVGTLIVAVGWAFRILERILGPYAFGIYHLYQFITYLPFYILSVSVFHFSSRAPLLAFAPFGMFVYVMWRLPATQLIPKFYDKYLIVIIYIIIIVFMRQFGAFALVSSIIGYFLWTNDLLMLRRQFDKHFAPEEYESPDPLANPRIEQIDAVLDEMVAMGFDEDDARRALDQYEGNMQAAITSLLEKTV